MLLCFVASTIQASSRVWKQSVTFCGLFDLPPIQTKTDCPFCVVNMPDFELVSEFQPGGDQPAAIKSLVKGLNNGKQDQVLLGVTGSGKTFTMANVIAQMNRPTLVSRTTRHWLRSCMPSSVSSFRTTR